MRFRSRKPHPNNILLTGLPRSGTTLACKVLSEQNDTIGLNEPIRWAGVDNGKKLVRKVAESFDAFRTSLIQSGVAQARTKSGLIAENHFERTSTGMRKKVVSLGEVKFDKALSPDFRLVLKTNAAFTLELRTLKRRYPIFAMIRNPLAVLGSWNSIDVPVSHGKLLIAEKIAHPIARKLDQEPDLIQRQLKILEFFYRQYEDLTSHEIIRYEDIARSNGQVFSKITGTPILSDSQWSNNNLSSIYDPKRMVAWGEAILASSGAIWTFYTRREVEQLINSYSALD